jgi:CRISPR-associated protein Cas2
VWLVAMFDLPVKTKLDRKNYTQFRKALMADGFMMLQYSVYARPLASEDAAVAHRRLIRRSLPPQGQVRVLTITDHQFGKMEVFLARKQSEAEQAPPQLMLF